ncbi:hypothetical protein BGZ61DRAFT_162977 [Ilyonectria robusta]|uniref:uncharacterized protein n=1 Tax=Ilyonectria robusta TaxID=1079257 RepID=UPI001E8D71AC|nr:uncharacterized protein BGZ61DRAFT_162977 [Ilyonectria robusta]KAH8733584.1 hypothetical protein BGZ61DRAFT_162977 [Ilyonectria robusta]
MTIGPSILNPQPQGGPRPSVLGISSERWDGPWPKRIARGTVGQPERAPYGRRHWLLVVPVARGVLQMHDLQHAGAGSRGFLERDIRSPFSKGSSQSHATWAAARCQIPSGRWRKCVHRRSHRGLALPPYSVVHCGLVVVPSLHWLSSLPA